MVGEPEAASALMSIRPRTPLPSGGRIVLYGYTPGEPAPVEEVILDRHGIAGFPVERVRGRAVDAASEALQAAESRGEHVVVHFDVAPGFRA